MTTVVKTKFLKVDQHAGGGKWLIHGTKHHKGSQLQSLELPSRISYLKILNFRKPPEVATTPQVAITLQVATTPRVPPGVMLPPRFMLPPLPRCHHAPGRHHTKGCHHAPSCHQASVCHRDPDCHRASGCHNASVCHHTSNCHHASVFHHTCLQASGCHYASGCHHDPGRHNNPDYQHARLFRWYSRCTAYTRAKWYILETAFTASVENSTEVTLHRQEPRQVETFLTHVTVSSSRYNWLHSLGVTND